MAGSFTTYRILCSTPPDLECEQDIFLAALARFAERVTLPEWILFAPATFRPPFNADLHKSAVEGNIRICDFFVQIFGEKSPSAAYKAFVDYALRCTADPAMPMRAATVFLRDPVGGDDMLALRKALDSDPQCDLRTYAGAEDLTVQLHAMFKDWYTRIKRTDQAFEFGSAQE